MKDELIKWRVMTQQPGDKWRKRGLFETKSNAMAKAKHYRDWTTAKAKVVRHIVAPAKCAPAITGGA